MGETRYPNLIYYPNLFKTFYVSSFKGLLKKFDLTQIDVDILLFLYNNSKYNTAKDICTMRGLSKSNVSTSLRFLEARGMVKSELGEKNKKLRIISLTDEASEMIEELSKKQTECLNTLVEGFSDDELETMMKNFNRINKNIELAMKKFEQTER